jgi:hypothetical protein
VVAYNVFFSPRPGADEPAVIAAVRGYLEEMRAGGKLHGYRILRVTDPASFPGIPRFQAIIDFPSQRDLDDSMTFMRRPGRVHEGAHGRMIGLIADFKVSFSEDA